MITRLNVDLYRPPLSEFNELWCHPSFCELDGKQVIPKLDPNGIKIPNCLSPVYLTNLLQIQPTQRYKLRSDDKELLFIPRFK